MAPHCSRSDTDVVTLLDDLMRTRCVEAPEVLSERRVDFLALKCLDMTISVRPITLFAIQAFAGCSSLKGLGASAPTVGSRQLQIALIGSGSSRGVAPLNVENGRQALLALSR
jgi:hypothetical protein